jgi:hypothetical protein
MKPIFFINQVAKVHEISLEILGVTYLKRALATLYCSLKTVTLSVSLVVLSADNTHAATSVVVHKIR